MSGSSSSSSSSSSAASDSSSGSDSSSAGNTLTCDVYSYQLVALIPAEGGSTGVDVIVAGCIAECTWVASADEPWISLSVSSGAGCATITVSAGANTTGFLRIGNLHIECAQDATSVDIPVQQDPAP